jgi:predicted CXXCH cytochrome family protein
VVSSAQPDPATWGGDHVGKPLPEYVTGDECLFCHRNDVGPTWGKNRHHLTIRPAEQGTTLVLGRGERMRSLRRGEEYGHLDLLDGQGRWDAKKFGAGCAGCHATAVDAKTRAFAAVSLDCFACHGDVAPKHANKEGPVYLAKGGKDAPRVVTSICAQCHVRTGTSRSTGLPYPHHFVAGDNLFRDFRVDLSPEALAKQNPIDRHVLENVRDVVSGKEDVTCLSCHDVHKGSSKKHHRLADAAICWNCHHRDGPKKDLKPLTVHSTTCGY